MDYAKACLKLRDKLILTQSDLAELLGTTNVGVCRWEKGVYQPQTAYKRKIAKLCKENNIEIEE